MQQVADLGREVRMGVEAGADGGAAERDLTEAGERILDAGDALPHLSCISRNSWPSVTGTASIQWSAPT